MRPNDYSLLLAALLAASANAQATTVINNPQDTAVTTVRYSICPTAATTTVTLPSTITFCPGGVDCNGGGKPTITAPPNPADAHTSTLLHVTLTGSDGKVTELAEYITVFDAPCTHAPGMCQATYTITESEDCPCHTNSAALPSGFTTTVHKCNACGPDNGPMTMTQTVPCSTGPYADVTPTMGPSPAAGAASGVGAGVGASAGAAASAGANAAAGSNGSGGNAAAGSNGSAGSSTAAGSNGSGNNAAANANAAAGVSAAAGGNGGSSPVGMADSSPAGMAGSGAAGANSSAGSAGSAMAGGNGAAPAGMGGNGGSGNMVGAAAGNGTSPPISGYTGAGERTAFAVTTLFAAVVGSLAWLL